MPQIISNSRTRRGWSTTEIVASTAIVGIMVVGALQSVGMVYRTRIQNMERLTGPGLARELMNEIMSMPYADPQSGGLMGLESGESLSSRATYDDVDDYNGYNATNAESKSGTALTGYTGWRLQAAVARANRTDGAGNAASDTGLKRITVTVTSASGKQTQLTALRAVSGVLEQSVSRSLNAVAWLEADLRLGVSTRSERAAAAVTNTALDAN